MSMVEQASTKAEIPSKSRLHYWLDELSYRAVMPAAVIVALPILFGMVGIFGLLFFYMPDTEGAWNNVSPDKRPKLAHDLS